MDYSETYCRIINGIMMEVTQSSIYPIPWTQGKETRPADYFERIQTVLSYNDINYEREEQQKKIEIIIPAVFDSSLNRKRIITVNVNQVPYSFSDDGVNILDMDQTFDIHEMQKLINLSIQSSSTISSSQDKTSYFACVPFFYMKEIQDIKPAHKQIEGLPTDGGLAQNHGHLKRMVLPYIQSMITNTSCDSREVYMPIVMPGKPHHWVVCILSLDQNNKPHLTYIDSSIKASKECVGFCQDKILPEINLALAEHQLDTIERHEINYNISKQFSQKGCGISASLTIEKLMTGEILSEEGIPLNLVQEGNEPYTSLSMEQDALRRVQLAFSLTRHQHYIEEQLNHHDTLSPADKHRMKEYKERLMDEIHTHPHSLKESAHEAFNEKESNLSKK